jgi:hypothetical protein
VTELLYLDGVPDGREHSGNLAAKEDQGDDGDDGDEREDECIFGKALSVLASVGHEERDERRHVVHLLPLNVRVMAAFANLFRSLEGVNSDRTSQKYRSAGTRKAAGTADGLRLVA